MTYDQIERYIVNTEVEGSKIYCEFSTPSGEIIVSEAPIRRVQSIKSQVERNVKRVVVNQARRTATRLLRSVLGGGMLGRTGSSILRTTTSSRNLNIRFTNEEKQAAVIEAFRKVQGQFPAEQVNPSFQTGGSIDNQDTGRKKISIKQKAAASKKQSSKELSALEQQIKKNPIRSNYDKEILARILVELANADGDISQEEQDLLQSYLPEHTRSVNDLLLMDPISPVECEEVSASSRSTIYTLAWVMTLVDFDLHPSEEGILMEYAEMFGFDEKEVEEIIKNAKTYVLEQAIDIYTRRDELFDLADQIKLDTREAERCLIRVKKRR